MYRRRSIWLGILGLVILLVLIGWVIYAILNTSDNGNQKVANKPETQSQSQSKTESGKTEPSNNNSAGTSNKTSDQSTGNQDNSASSGTSQSNSANRSASESGTTRLTDTGSGEVFTAALIVAAGAAILHRLYTRRTQKV